MPPRRNRKVGLKRIDAAVDACASMGFSRSIVRSKVKEVLKEYGGDEGWVFIEEGSYKVLIEALLEDQEKQKNCEVDALPWQEPDSSAEPIALTVEPIASSSEPIKRGRVRPRRVLVQPGAQLITGTGYTGQLRHDDKEPASSAEPLKRGRGQPKRVLVLPAAESSDSEKVGDEMTLQDTVLQPGPSNAETSMTGGKLVSDQDSVITSLNLALQSLEQDIEFLKSEAGLGLLCFKELTESTNPEAVPVLPLPPPPATIQTASPVVESRGRHFGWFSRGKNHNANNFVLLTPHPVSQRAGDQPRRRISSRWDSNPRG
ncbi:hypothetical protein Droror1_Dr00026185 [Drosera rotundifolia]